MRSETEKEEEEKNKVKKRNSNKPSPLRASLVGHLLVDIIDSLPTYRQLAFVLFWGSLPVVDIPCIGMIIVTWVGDVCGQWDFSF